MRRRGRTLLMAQRRPRFRGAELPPLTEGPPEWLEADGREMWEAIRAATPARLAAVDAIMLAIASATVADWRRERGTLGELRFCYRLLGDFFVPMPERRRLLFPDQAFSR
jgi:hypothetical protein